MSVFRCWLVLLLVCLACVPGAMAQPELPTENEARSLTFSPDGKLLALAIGSPGERRFTARRLEIWDVATGQRRHSLKCEPQEFTFFAFSPDNTRVLSCGLRPRQLWVNMTNPVAWDIRTGQQVYELEVERGEIIWMPVFSSDGALIAASTFGKDEPRSSHLKVWDAKTGKLKQNLDALGGNPSQVSFTTNGEYLVVSIASRIESSNRDSRLLFIKSDSLLASHSIPAEITGRTGFSLAPDGKSLIHFYVTHNEEHNIEIASADFHLNLLALHDNSVSLPLQMETRQIHPSAFTFNPAATEFFVVVFFFAEKRPVELWRWDTKTGQRLSALSLGDYTVTQAKFAAISPDAQTLAIARGTTVELRRTRDGELLRTFDVL